MYSACSVYVKVKSYKYFVPEDTEKKLGKIWDKMWSFSINTLER